MHALAFRAIFYFSFATFLSGQAYALEWLPEFQSLTEAEEQFIENPAGLNPEYQSDILTYTRPEQWEYLWLIHPVALDFSAGSVSAKHFMTEGRVKLRKFLTDELEFRFTAFEEKNFERDSSQRIVELVYWPFSKIGLSLYGSPVMEKRNDDTGLALLIKPHDTHEIRLFNTFVDVARLRRSDRNETYVQPYQPYARGIVGRIWSAPGPESSENFYEYALRYETKTHWKFHDLNYEYRYSKRFASFFMGKKINDDHRVFVRFQFDRRLEDRSEREGFLTDRWFLNLRSVWHNPPFGKGWEVSPGVQFALRNWNGHEGKGTHRDVLPHITFRIPAFGSGETRDFVELGLQGQWHRMLGDRVIFDDEDEDAVVNSRINIAYDFQFKERMSIRLLASADLDEIGTRESWEGGNGQVRIHF